MNARLTETRVQYDPEPGLLLGGQVTPWGESNASRQCRVECMGRGGLISAGEANRIDSTQVARENDS